MVKTVANQKKKMKICDAEAVSVCCMCCREIRRGTIYMLLAGCQLSESHALYRTSILVEHTNNHSHSVR